MVEISPLKGLNGEKFTFFVTYDLPQKFHPAGTEAVSCLIRFPTLYHPEVDTSGRT